MRLVSLRCSSANRVDQVAIKDFAARLPEELRMACEPDTAGGVRFHYSRLSTAAHWVHIRPQEICSFELCRVRRLEAEAVDAELKGTIAWTEAAVRQAIDLALSPVSIF